MAVAGQVPSCMTFGSTAGPCTTLVNTPEGDSAAAAVHGTWMMAWMILWSWILLSALCEVHDRPVEGVQVGDREATAFRKSLVGAAVEPAMLLLEPIG